VFTTALPRKRACCRVTPSRPRAGTVFQCCCVTSSRGEDPASPTAAQRILGREAFSCWLPSNALLRNPTKGWHVTVCFISVGFVIVIMQYQVAIATNSRALTCFMNVSYIVGHERSSSLWFQYIVFLLSALIIDVDLQNVVYIHIKRTVYDWIFMRVILTRWRETLSTRRTGQARNQGEVGSKHKVYCLNYSSTMKMEAIFSSETSVDFQCTTRRYILEYRTLPPSLASALDGSEWPDSHSGHFSPEEKAHSTNWIGGWVGPEVGMDVIEKRKYCACQESNPVHKCR
jgi:hypothetical protein